MNNVKSIGLSLSVISTLGLGLVGCGSDNSNDNIDNQITGYLVDSGIKGLTYKTSDGFSGKTAENGLYNCKDGSTIEFFLGTTQLGEAVECREEPITPIELFNSTKEEYRENQSIKNALRLLQSLDKDEIHSNGIEITTEVLAALENESIDFTSSNNVENILKTVYSQRELVDEEESIINFHDTLSMVQANTVISTDPKIKSFEQYSRDYFSLKRNIVDQDNKDAISNIGAITAGFQSAVTSISSFSDKNGKILQEGTPTYEKALKTSTDVLFPLVMTVLNLPKEQEAIGKTLTSTIVELILLNKVDKNNIDDAAINFTKNFIGNTSTILGYTFTGSEEEGMIVSHWINMVLFTYDMALGDVQTKVASGINTVASIASTTAMILETNDFITKNGDLLIAQEYVKLFYRNGETKYKLIDVINKNIDNSIFSTDLPKLLEQATEEDIISTIAEGNFMTNNHPWYALLSEDDYNMENVKKIIEDFIYKFELHYAAMQESSTVFDDINTELAEDEISDVTEGKELVSEEPEKDEINVDINTLTAQECKEKTVDVDFASNIWTNSIDTWNDVTLACAPILLEVSNETTQDVDTEKNSLDYSTYSSTYKLASTDCQTKDAASWDSLYKDLLSTFAPSSNIMDSVSSCQKAIATVEQGYSFEQAINSVNTMNEPFSDSPAVVKYW